MATQHIGYEEDKDTHHENEDMDPYPARLPVVRKRRSIT
jgi:hypothetical protein